MKKLLLLPVFTILLFGFSFAQSVGINNDGLAPDASAMLHVRHPNKGLLAPRVALTGTGDISTIPSAATSLLVFNTATNGAGATTVTPGYYYWSGTEWLRISTASGSGLTTSWLLTGNAGTVEGTNFIGTTDNIPFNVRVNNQKAGRIDHLLQNTFWGYRAGDSNTTGDGHTAIGQAALQNNTTGWSNTALGAYALHHNKTGFENTAVGASALISNISGKNNTAIGQAALIENITGNYK